MAIKKQVVTPHGFSVDDAYHRVENVTITGKTKMNFSLHVYKDPAKEAFSSSSFVCAYDLNGSNPLVQAYEHLKAQEEYKDAKDC